jgi:hypothetical protein
MTKASGGRELQQLVMNWHCNHQPLQYAALTPDIYQAVKLGE